MPLIVVMEDDATLQLFITSVLKKHGFEVASAVNGFEGLELVRQLKPDAVVSDVQMPVMDGFQMLAELRQDAKVAAIPVVLLTSLSERAHMRIGMTAGADDYLVKPFRPNELVDAVKAQLDKRDVEKKMQAQAVGQALDMQKASLTKRYEKRLFEELNGRWSSSLDNEEDTTYEDASVLFVELLNPALSEELSNAEMTDVVKRAYRSSGDTVNLFGARHLQMVGQSLLAIFVDDEKTPTVTHQLRAIRAALGLVDSVGMIDLHLKNKFADRNLPQFRVSVALHSGSVTIAKVTDPLNGAPPQIWAVGKAVNLTQLLHDKMRSDDWQITASSQILAGVPVPPRTGRNKSVQLRRKIAPLEALELLGLGT